MPGFGIDSQFEEDISIHIFTVSASLVGICLTVIGIVHILNGLLKVNTIVDDMLAIDSFIFLCSCLLSYWALRVRKKRRMHQIEYIADAIFLVPVC